MKATQDLHAFIESAVKGLVDAPEKARVETIESGERTVTHIIHCDPDDLKFIYSRMKAIKFIAIAIAQRHKSIVNVLINE